jgi:hypothetical protein
MGLVSRKLRGAGGLLHAGCSGLLVESIPWTKVQIACFKEGMTLVIFCDKNLKVL